MPLLEVVEVTKIFGGLIAVDDVNLGVGEWEITGLIGPNGAGKTTLFNCVTGVYRPERGQILYRGRDTTELPSHRRAALGMARSFQQVGLIRGSSVLQNLITAQHLVASYTAMEALLGAPDSWTVESDLVRRADRILGFTDLVDYRDALLDDLPFGILKRVELAAVLATDPRLILLDEPSSGLSPAESEVLGEVLLRLRAELGLTIFMIEHHVPLVMRTCDYVYVLNFGKLIAQGKPEEVQRHPEVVAAYLGGDVTVGAEEA